MKELHVNRLTRLLFLFLLIVSTPLQAVRADSTPCQLRIIWTEDPQAEALIAWSTRAEADVHTVYYDKKDHGDDIGEYRYEVAAQKSGKYEKSEAPYFYHHAQIKKLTYDTTYYFVVKSGDKISRTYHFRTAPKSDKPVTIIHGGDSRSGIVSRQGINRMIADTVAETEDLIAFAHGGDFVGSGRNLKLWDQWLTDHELTITKDGRVLPIIPARGNHEGGGQLYDQIFGYPGGGLGKNYFATKLSSQIMFVTLNSETDVGGDQMAFLEETLKKSRRIRWRVVQYHRPALYPAVKGPGRTKEWVPVFEKYDVQLACEADGHCIKRTVPIRDGKKDPEGVVYIGEGGLGVGQRAPKKDLWYLQPPGVTGAEHHFMLLKFEKSGLTIETRLLGGKTFDEFKISAR